MTSFRFEWDEAKSRSNQRKHGLSFEEASQAFRDPLLLSVQDRVEEGKQRWRAYGAIGGFVLVVVAHTLRAEGAQGAPVEVIRIISARTPRERRRYEEENG
jgi:uncharacterized DUF497 family protein